MTVTTKYICAGGNRHASAADWSERSARLAYGADSNVAICPSHDGELRGVETLLTGHKDKIQAVKFFAAADGTEYLLSGAADGELRIWQFHGNETTCVSLVQAHSGAIADIAATPSCQVFATASTDSTVKLWRIALGEATCVHMITLKPRYIPLTVVISSLGPDSSFFVAVGGTRKIIQVYSILLSGNSPSSRLAAELSGHEGWIQSLALRSENKNKDSDLLLASASQDKYVRIWRFHTTSIPDNRGKEELENGDIPERSLVSKIQKVSSEHVTYSITFDALLLGHEDWIYTTRWSSPSEELRLLTASADNTLTIWEPDPESAIWISTTRLGEISGQKGATTATGSTGGFWIGLWSSDGSSICALGRTGSWRRWTSDQAELWALKTGINGHVGSVNDIAWESNGSYLLSTSSDQTTRLHAKQTSGQWHEFCRPQIHGYDLNCVTAIGDNKFVSGADEKLLRVFQEPKVIAEMLRNTCGIDTGESKYLPETAAIPVLGLSNKAEGAQDTNGGVIENEDSTSAAPAMNELTALTSAPTEDLLSRHTLWPETEKLYGHGYEISAVAYSSSANILATACKASSIDHAVIRLYDCLDWHELKPPLTAHSLTIARLSFSPCGKELLSVGRDRQWAVFRQDAQDRKLWKLAKNNLKAHSRMILDATWLCTDESLTFATAGRDKTVKIWKDFELITTIAVPQPATAVACIAVASQNRYVVAVGQENGRLSLHFLDISDLHQKNCTDIQTALCPSKSITRLAWRPSRDKSGNEAQLAVASADSSVRILEVPLSAGINGL